MINEQDPAGRRTQLARLAAALTARNFHAEVQVPAGGFPTWTRGTLKRACSLNTSTPKTTPAGGRGRSPSQDAVRATR
jgi:hypothetical protein